MSHIHLPDGVLPPIMWILGYFLCFIFLWLAVRKIRKNDARKKIPFVSVMAALMLIVMSIPLGILPIHLSLGTLVGILVGPSLGFIAVFVVNIILAMMGHGGITTAGINTLLLGSEVMLGFYIFNLLKGKLKNVAASVISTIVAILVSVTLMLAILIPTVGLEGALHTHDHNHEGKDIESTEQADDAEIEADATETVKFLTLSGWTAIIMILIVGILIESFVTGLIIGFFTKVRPDILENSHKTN